MIGDFLWAAILRLFDWLLPPNAWDWPDDEASDSQ